MTQSHGHEGLKNIGEGADGGWKWQVRFNLRADFAAVARTNMDDPSLKPLKDIMDRHGVRLTNQFDNFAGYCRKAEEEGKTDSALYRWTKATIDNPAKQVGYAKRFTVYQGENQIYDKDLADAIEADLQPLVESGMISQIDKFDSNPKNSPQAPARFL